MPDQQNTALRNTWVLTAVQSLGGASTPIVVSLGGLVGQQLASNPALVTLPVSLLNLGLALGTIPAAMVMRRFGRRSGYVFGATLGMMADLIATTGIVATTKSPTPPVFRHTAHPGTMRGRQRGRPIADGQRTRLLRNSAPQSCRSIDSATKSSPS